MTRTGHGALQRGPSIESEMMRLPDTLKRLAATFAAVVPLLAGTDPCTVGALTGNASSVCVSKAEAAMVCHIEATSQPVCSRCAPPGTAPAPRSTATCCDLKPQAPGAAQAPALAVPAPSAHPAPAATIALPAPVAVWTGVATSASNHSPPGELARLLAPRAPPLS